MLPTKTQYSINIENELLKKIDDFQFENRYRSRSSATVELIKIAMQTLEGKEPEEPQKNKPALSEQEENLLALYRQLDEKRQEEVMEFADFKRAKNKNTPPQEI